jgi:hypothetical protein
MERVFGFETALTAMNHREAVRRQAWKRGPFVIAWCDLLRDPITVTERYPVDVYMKHRETSRFRKYRVRVQFLECLPDGEARPWVPTPEDLTADDWEISPVFGE